VAGLRRRSTGFRSLHEALDTTTPGGRLVFHVFAALAEFIRGLIVEGFALFDAATRAARPGSSAAGLACRAPDAQARADLGGQRRVRGAAEDRDLTHLRMPGFPAGTAAGRRTP
jgi:DNA invertase Pin-like site-specific DNA recombinase